MPELPPIFVISLARAKARREAVCGRLDAMGLRYEIVDAVDGANADPVLYRHRLRQDIARLKMGYELSTGMIGCFLSHSNLWERIAAEGMQHAVVLEDDAAPTSDFANVVSDVVSSPAPWDVVILTTPPYKTVSAVVQGVGGKYHTLGRCRYRLLGTAGYLINLRAAQKLPSICREISEPVDVAWCKWWSHKLTFYCVTPQVVREAERDSVIDYNVRYGNIAERAAGVAYRRWHRILCQVARLTNPLPKIPWDV